MSEMWGLKISSFRNLISTQKIEMIYHNFFKELMFTAHKIRYATL